VNGLYDNNTNQKEAEEILKLLFEEIQPGADGAYPSIGIATLNMTQQRFIWEMIWDKADQDETIRQKLVALEESGFFIKNLENIQGDQRDIIIISTTFGVRPDGKFIQNFGPLKRDTGYKMLNVIVTRAKYKLYVVSSVPRSFYQEFRDELITKGNTGKGIFYAYLNYVRFCDEGNEEARVALLDFLSSNQGEEVAVCDYWSDVWVCQRISNPFAISTRYLASQHDDRILARVVRGQLGRRDRTQSRQQCENDVSEHVVTWMMLRGSPLVPMAR
jgi:hypothetical protein